DLKILNAPTDIEITTTNLRQDDATISWKINIPTNYEVKSYSIKISNGKQEVAFESQGHYTLSPSDTYFKTAGDWTISVKAVGLYDTISSSYSNNISITRLQPSESLTITSDGIVRWAEVAGAESYILEYSYQLNDLSTQNKTIATSDNKFTTNNGYLEYSGIKDEELDLLFSGNITAKVYTVGTGSSSAKGTLTSVKDQTFNRIEAPEVELGNTNITFVNYENYTGSEKIFIKATIDGEVVVNGNVTPVKQDNKYVWTYPKTFYRQDGSVIEIGAGKQINFEIYASSTSPNTVNSNIISKSAIQLGEITNLRFIREDGKIKFYADNSNATASTTQVTIAGQIFENVGNLEVEITDNLLSLIPSSWTITAMAKCDSEGDNVYINSKETSISGVKLSNVTNIVVNANHTKVQWNNVANASAYKLSVFEINSPENVNYYDKTSLEEDMSSYNSGEYSFSVKTIGNIGNTYITENIILDSTYSNNVTITKLPKIQNISLNKGYISLDEVSGADAVVAVLSETLDGTTEEYQLTLIDGHPAGEAGNYYTSETLMAKLDSVEGKQYYLRFYAKATKNNYISSSFADIDGVSGSENYIIVRLFGESDYEISLNFKDIDGTNVNYAVTYATFKTNTNINDGILLDVDNEITPTTNLTYTVDANGTWEEGDHIIRYAQFGSSTIDADRVVYLTSFGQPRTIVKLSNSTINITKQRIQAGLYENMLQFSSVSNADGYYVYLDGELRILDKNQKFIDLSSYEAGEYSTIGIRAISKIPGYIAGITSYLLNTDRQPQAIKKITTPESFKIIDGALCWDISNEILNLVLGEIESPVYTSYSLIQEQYIKIKFTNKATGVATEFLDELAKYLYISESAKQQNESAYLEIANIASYNGFPSINYSFLDFAQSLIAGEYDVQAKIIGNPIDGSELPLFTSDYSRAITTYVGYAPQIRIENNNDVYNLKFTSVIVNSNYYSASSLPKYNLAGIYNESGKEVREIITSISPTTFNAANETITFNLTSLIQNGELTSKYSSLYVYIAGNTLGPNTSLNGKCSNIIKIKVLEEIKASVQRGVINWNAQADATKYVVTYRLTDNVEERFDVNYVEGLSIYEWGCEQLLANQAYTLTITAYGTQGVNASEGDLVIISGPKTYLGTIIKLQTIANEINAVEMEKGAYKWAHITNATNYDVVISETEITSGVYGTITDTLKVDEDNILNYYFYETTANDAVNYYYFRAVGTEDLALSSISIAYVNSNYSKYNKGIRNANISDVKFE
ncbi:MAG: hypothetical protein IJW25_00410, partial [Clostridia bacterium]|nr:hypothetical protein [Clostridia bacterium]